MAEVAPIMGAPTGAPAIPAPTVSPSNITDLAQAGQCTCEYISSLAQAVQMTIDEAERFSKEWAKSGRAEVPETTFRLAQSLLNCLDDQALALMKSLAEMEAAQTVVTH